MIRFAWYSVLLGLMSLPAGAQEVVSPDPVSEQPQVTTPAVDAQLVGQVAAQTTVAESDEDLRPAVVEAALKAVEPDPQASAPAASEPSPKDQKPTVAAAAAPKAVEPDPQASAPAASEPSLKEQKPTVASTAAPPASVEPAPKPQQQVVAKRKPKPQKHAVRSHQYRGTRYVWLYPIYGQYIIYAGRTYVAYGGYYPIYRY